MTFLQLIGIIGAFTIFVFVSWWCINHDCSNNSQWQKAMEKMTEEKFPYMWKVIIAKPHWISVKDRKPEVGAVVLTTTQNGTQRVGWYEDGWWLANFPNLVRMGSITHWMPLPSPPEHIADVSKKKTACPDCIMAEFPGCDLDIPCCMCDEQCNSRQPCQKKGE